MAGFALSGVCLEAGRNRRLHCVTMDRLTEAGLCAGAWCCEALSHRQDCVEEVAFDGGAQSGDDPQNGQ
jgi:hypothetical protein